MLVASSELPSTRNSGLCDSIKLIAIKFAPFNRAAEYRTEIDQLLLAIAKYLIEDGESPEEWVDFTFVSNESSLGDFLSSEDDLVSLATDLQLRPLAFATRW